MPVPLLDLTRENKPLLASVEEALHLLFEKSHFVMGQSLLDFEASALEYLEMGDDHFTLGVSSGTDALLLGLMVLGLKPGDKVVVPPFTFFATAGVVERLGLIPYFVDIDQHSFNLSTEALKKADDPEIKAIIPVHLYGQAADISKIVKIAKEKNWYVLEDAAQAIGAKEDSKQVGHFGDLCAYSFYPTKNLGAFGDAGLLVGKKEFEEKAKRMRVHGMKDRYSHLEVGGNFRMDAIQAAVLNIKIKNLNDWHLARRGNAKKYNEMLANIDGLVLPQELDSKYHTYNQYVIRVKDNKRNELKTYLDEKQVGNMIYYPTPLHTQPCFSELGYKYGDFSISEQACKEVLALPIYPYLSDEEHQEVCETIISFY